MREYKFNGDSSPRLKPGAFSPSSLVRRIAKKVTREIAQELAKEVAREVVNELALELVNELRNWLCLGHTERARSLDTTAEKLVYYRLLIHQPDSFTNIRRALNIGKKTLSKALKKMRRRGT